MKSEVSRVLVVGLVLALLCSVCVNVYLGAVWTSKTRASVAKALDRIHVDAGVELLSAHKDRLERSYAFTPGGYKEHIDSASGGVRYSWVRGKVVPGVPGAPLKDALLIELESGAALVSEEDAQNIAAIFGLRTGP